MWKIVHHFNCVDHHSAMEKCPFYGFRWPDRTATLFGIGGSECGLDLEGNGPCLMEASGCAIDYRRCEVAERMKPFLSFGASKMRFIPAGSTQLIAFEDWTNRVMSGRDDLGVGGSNP
jgi:hypothetical protein